MSCGEGEGDGASRRMCGGSASSHSSEEDEALADDLDAPLLRTSPGGSREVRIDVPTERAYTTKFPPEIFKGFIAFLMVTFAGVMNDIVLSVVHERVPPGPPLPDIFFDVIPYREQALIVAEYLMLSNFGFLVLLIAFHRHRSIVFRRVCLIGSLLYSCRCVTMLVTQVPVADPNYYCSPKFGIGNLTLGNVILRGIQVAAGLGLKLNGMHTLCGDYIYSGHTIVLLITALFICEYSPRRWRLLHAITWLVALAGMVFLVVSRGHYTIDIVLSYYICTRIFWIYHTFAAFPALRMPSSNNHLSRVFWFPLFYYMEKNVTKPVPRRFDSPIPKIRQLLRSLKPNQQ